MSAVDICQDISFIESNEIYDIGYLTGKPHEIMISDARNKLWRKVIPLEKTNEIHSKIDIDEQGDDSQLKQAYTDKDQLDWIKALLKKANEIGPLLSKGEHRNKEIVEKAISTITEMSWRENNIDKVIIAGIKSHYEKFATKSDSSEYDGSINIKSIFNAMKFHLILRQELISIDTEFYIDADAQLIGLIACNGSNKLNIIFNDDGEIKFSNIDRTAGRVRVSGTAYLGDGSNNEETLKIKKITSLVTSNSYV